MCFTKKKIHIYLKNPSAYINQHHGLFKIILSLRFLINKTPIVIKTNHLKAKHQEIINLLIEQLKNKEYQLKLSKEDYAHLGIHLN
jgi:hypothetical protein